MVKIETVLIVYLHPNILLGMKKVGFGKGKYNGFGGKVKDGETLEEAVTREVFEEAGIKIKNPERVGKILFKFESGEEEHIVHFFKVNKTKGTPKESDEMKPEWFDIENIPYEKMWADDKYWLPLLLSGKKSKGKFHFDKNLEISDYKLTKIDRLE